MIVIGVCIGFALGVLAALCVLRKGTIGNLVVIDDPDEGSYMFLEISKTDIQELRTQPIIKLKVVDKGKTTLK